MSQRSSSFGGDANTPSRSTAPVKSPLVIALTIAALLIGYWLQQHERPTGKQPQVAGTSEENDEPILLPPANRQSESPAETRPEPARTGQDRSSKDTEKTSPSRSAKQDTPTLDKTVVANVVVRDQSGRVIFRGDVDLQPTLDRIAAGKRLSFSQDGTVFQNREGRLPRKSSGYYHEFVHPTPGESGPGPQRVVTGNSGEIYYTHDHYRTFRRIE